MLMVPSATTISGNDISSSTGFSMITTVAQSAHTKSRMSPLAVHRFVSNKHSVTSDSVNVAGIVGGLVGGLLSAALVIGLVVCLVHRRRRSQNLHTPDPYPQPPVIVPYLVSAGTSYHTTDQSTATLEEKMQLLKDEPPLLAVPMRVPSNAGACPTAALRLETASQLSAPPTYCS